MKGVKGPPSMYTLDGACAASQEFGVGLVADLMMTADFRAAAAAFQDKRRSEAREK